MKKETYYECPVCHSIWTTQSEAISCRNQHPAKIEEWYYCEVCGQGWNAHAHWGEKGAAERARKCEQKHRDNGEIEEVSRRTFFLSGGARGRYYPLTREESEEMG